MAITSTEKFKLHKFIKSIEKFKGRHTELVTVYVPAGYDLNKVINQLSQEQGTAKNIKSKATRDNVQAALEKMIQHLRTIGLTPPNGLAAFSGNVSEREGQEDIQVFSLQPPVPINLRLYRCDKEFILDALREMCDTDVMYGLVVLDRRDAIIAMLKGKTIIPLVKTHSEVPGKFKAGGQSSVRFARNRELAAVAHYKKVADYMKDQFLGKQELKGILVGGPGPTKYDFVDGNYITNELKLKIVTIKDLSYTEEFGLQELVDRCEDVLASEEIAAEKKIMNEFLTMFNTNIDKVAYGENDCKKHLMNGVVDTLLISEEADEKTIEEFEAIAKQFNSTVKIISTQTREGVQLRDLGKFGVILRYAIES